jgi:succinate dehydrogenase hydrophobic anchor subunit
MLGTQETVATMSRPSRNAPKTAKTKHSAAKQPMDPDEPAHVEPSPWVVSVAGVILTVLLLALIGVVAFAVVWVASLAERWLGLPSAQSIAAFLGIALLLTLRHAAAQIGEAVRHATFERAERLYELDEALGAQSDELSELSEDVAKIIGNRPHAHRWRADRSRR